MRGRWLWLGVLALACFPGAANGQTPAAVHSARPPTGSRDAVIRVYNYAGAPPDEVAAANAEAVRLLDEAGVATEWRICPAPAKTEYLPEECKSTGLAREFVVNLLPRRMTKGFDISPRAFGLTLHDPAGRTGQIAWIFYARVRDAAHGGPATVPQLLGHAFAHEVGHLLFGNTEHSEEGLMRALWGEKEIRLAATGKLGFNVAESQHLRLAVLLRQGSPGGEVAGTGMHQ